MFPASALRPLIAIVASILALSPARASRFSADYSLAILSDSISSGGGVGLSQTFEIMDAETGVTDPVLSGDYQITASVGDMAEAVTDVSGAIVGVPGTPTKISGFCGMLYEIKSLQLAATPSTLSAGNSSTLKLTAVLHDNSAMVVDPRYAGWQSTGPVVLSLDAAQRKLATAQGVPVQTAASVVGSFLRTSGTELPVTASAAITVQANGTGIGIDPDWLAAYNLSAIEANSDADKDGIPQLLEAVFNFNPHAPDGQPAHTSGSYQESGSKYLTLRFRHNTRNTGVSIFVERATALSSANFITNGVVELMPRDAIDAKTEWRTFRSTTPISSSRAEFLRLRAVHNPPAN